MKPEPEITQLKKLLEYYLFILNDNSLTYQDKVEVLTEKIKCFLNKEKNRRDSHENHRNLCRQQNVMPMDLAALACNNQYVPRTPILGTYS